MSWPDGRTYEGRFQHNVQCGFGVGHTPPPNGADYTGYWSRGKMNGYGVLKSVPIIQTLFHRLALSILEPCSYH